MFYDFDYLFEIEQRKGCVSKNNTGIGKGGQSGQRG